jgi:formylglycine-generating enzyme required for sulfatase activity
MKQLLKNGARFLLVTVGIIFLTSFTIDATDTLRGSQSALGIFSQNMFATSCPKYMSEIETSVGRVCVDMYEASVGQNCVIAEPRAASDTALNVADSDCVPLSLPDALPWIYAAQPQAEQLCAKVGKRLPTAEEWYVASKGTPDGAVNCNLNGTLSKTAAWNQCVSGTGIFDMVGNVWEMLADTVTPDSAWGRAGIPEEGYVALVNEHGLPIETASEPNVVFNSDYFWSGDLEYSTIMRGGYYGSRTDGGVYATHAKTAPTFASAAIGFRCVRSL